MSAAMTRAHRRDILAATPCQWCHIVGHQGSCRVEWMKLAAEQAAKGRPLMVPDTAVCPWCRRSVVSPSVDCQATLMVEVAP